MSCGQASYHATCWHQLVVIDGPWLVIAGQDVRLSTVLTGLLLAAGILWRTRSVTRAVAGAMAWLCGYEILFLVTTTALLGWPWRDTIWQTSAIAGFVLWAWALRVRPQPALLGLFALAWLAWILTGLHANWPTSEHAFRWGDEVANVATKGLLALAYLLGSEALVRSGARLGVLQQLAHRGREMIRQHIGRGRAVERQPALVDDATAR